MQSSTQAGRLCTDLADTRGEYFVPGREVYARLPPLSGLAWWVLALEEGGRRPIVCVLEGPTNRDLFLQDLETLCSDAGRVLGVFPAWESLPQGDTRPRPEIAGERMDMLLRCHAGDTPPVLVTTIQAVMQRTPSAERLAGQSQTVHLHQEIDPGRLADDLTGLGYFAGLQVTAPTEIALRGGILDAWPPTEPNPVRIEFFGSTVESIRWFDPVDQRSLGSSDSVCLAPASEWGGGDDHLAGTLFDFLPGGITWLLIDPEAQAQQAALLEERALEIGADAYIVAHAGVQRRIADDPASSRVRLEPTDGGGVVHDLGLEPLPGLPALPEGAADPDRLEAERTRFIEGILARRAEGETVRFFLATEGTRDRLLEQYGGEPWSVAADMVDVGRLSEGFRAPAARFTAVAENDLYGRRKQWRGRTGALPGRSRPRRKGRAVSDWTDLQPGEHVVHHDHGIGKYLGLFEMSFNGRDQEVITLEYRDNAKLHLPVTQAHLLTRYVGVGTRPPALHRIGGRKWATDRFGAERAVQDMAAAMLETQAERELKPGTAAGPDVPWQVEFEAAFPFEETPDQFQAIVATKRDMEQPHPMDRLICGDVGYGKTEVAMRAAFKTVMDGRQVAVLVPTTVLAQQHADTFSDRMTAFPVTIGMLSRFQTKGQQSRVVEAVKEGAVDIVIGTHRLLQNDIAFHDLGLLIIDEEQRFGVEQKERIKRMRTQVDVLTMSATPIPRTLYMSLVGAKEMSTIQSPPQERLPIETVVAGYDDALVRKAILREINRGGQVYFLHNRVKTIARVAEGLSRLVPEAKIATGHGQMHEKDLAGVMRTFVQGEIDVLVCTTIIESGVDIPNVNTMIVDRADRFGLAEMYQLRGRVGRFNRQAYCFLLLPRDRALMGPARQRIAALTRYAGLGAGFRLALKDLEIRGAGNLLGAAQSGHINSIGFELYCQFLKRTVARMRGEEVPPLILVELQLDFITLATADAFRDDAAVIPLAYIEDEDLRVHAYRRLATATREEDVGRLAEELADRFGPVPPPVHRLLQMNRVRILAAAREIDVVESRGDKIMLTRDGEYIKDGPRFPRFTGGDADAKLEDLVRVVRAVRKA